MAAGVWDGADRPAGLEEMLGSPLLRLFASWVEGDFRGLQESHEEMGVVLESRVEQEMPHACPDGSHKR